MLRKKRVLILCTDNRYRSPLCYAMMSQYHRLECISAGFDEASVGYQPPEIILQAANELGKDLSKFRSITLEPCLLEWAEEYVVLDAFTRASLKGFREELGYSNLPRTKLHVLGEYLNPKDRIVDPLDYDDFGWDEYQRMIDQIVLGSHNLAKILAEDHSRKN